MSSHSVVPRARSVLAVLLLVGLVLIGQKVSSRLYTFGILLTVVVVVLGFTFNNIGEDRSGRQVVVPLLATWVIVAVIFGLAFVLAPVLTRLGG
jgi:lipopolysaccharide export LptBFGC system permease protein LptF